MRAFLSQSSKNKPFVREVFGQLGSYLAEFDENTFQYGNFNVDAIIASLTRSDLFVLFATSESLSSGYVELEAKYALEFLAQKKNKAVFSLAVDGQSQPFTVGWRTGLAVEDVMPGEVVRQVLGGDPLEAGDPALEAAVAGIGVLDVPGLVADALALVEVDRLVPDLMLSGNDAVRAPG
ncbi:MAG: TIR domain-containing protein, partial [Verrucomicrobiae bacterium]|nr:TIR domain-containing protein [Verrucomicrobiae bacterium]